MMFPEYGEADWKELITDKARKLSWRENHIPLDNTKHLYRTLKYELPTYPAAF